MLLTTREVAELLRVHPKQVYRLLKRGMPAHRVGDEWRFDRDRVLSWANAGVGATTPEAAPPPPLLAANGDVVIELLLEIYAKRGGPPLGFVQSDHTRSLDLLRKGSVLAAGCHVDLSVPEPAGAPLVCLELAQRELGLVTTKSKRVTRVEALVGRRLASRPPTAGVRQHLDAALRGAGVDAKRIEKSARIHDSHRAVALAVLRGEADVGLASHGWAIAAGLAFHPLAEETYGIVVRAENLGDPRMVALCEVVQSGEYRRRLAGEYGYGNRRTGRVRNLAVTPEKGTVDP